MADFNSDIISKAVFDLPVQPLFNTITDTLVKAGIPVVMTNTNNNLIVNVKAKIGSAPQSTKLTAEMFAAAPTTISTGGVLLVLNQFFTQLDLTSVVIDLPNEMREGSSGYNEGVLYELMTTIGNQFSMELLANLYATFDAQIRALIPAAQIKSGNAGKIEWNPTKTVTGDVISIVTILNDIIANLPNTMLPGGIAGESVVVYVSAQNFITLSLGVNSAYQYRDAGGASTFYFQYVKEASTIDETRNKFRNNRVEYGNLIILPLNGLANDTLLCSYQFGVEKEQVFYEKIPVKLLDNIYVAVKGAFKGNKDLTVPVQDMSRGFFDLPYQCGNLFAINKVETAQMDYNIIASLSAGFLFKEIDKVQVYLPSTAPTTLELPESEKLKV